MKMTDVGAAKLSTLELDHPFDEGKCGVTVTGYTTESQQWKQKRKELARDKDKKRINFAKGGGTYIEVDEDDTQRQLMIASITKIEGFDDWEYSESAKQALFAEERSDDEPSYEWILHQWGAHINENQRFLPKSASKRKSGRAA